MCHHASAACRFSTLVVESCLYGALCLTALASLCMSAFGTQVLQVVGVERARTSLASRTMTSHAFSRSRNSRLIARCLSQRPAIWATSTSTPALRTSIVFPRGRTPPPHHVCGIVVSHTHTGISPRYTISLMRLGLVVYMSRSTAQLAGTTQRVVRTGRHGHCGTDTRVDQKL
jgi:hypothetical protein